MDPTLKISLIVLAATIWGYINYRNHRKSREAPELAAPPPNIQIAEEELAAAAAGEEPTAPSPDERPWRAEYASVPMGVPLGGAPPQGSPQAGTAPQSPQ